MDWHYLQNRIKGRVISRSSDDFLAVTHAMVWNEVKPRRLPEVIVSVKNEDDVVEAINFARNHGLRVVVHGGGHTWCGLAVRQGGMIIDLSELNESKIDKTSQTAIIQPVISNRELARRLGNDDLAFPIGHCPTVKASGYLLNGGMSWNLSHWGPACLSVEAIEFVMANGQKITANQDEHRDLFWAARGCGPGMFAVATRFHLKCYPLPKAIMTSTYYYSLDYLQEVATEVVELGQEMPDITELSIFLVQAPPELKNKCKSHKEKLCMVTAVVFGNTPDESIKALSILEEGQLIKTCLAKKINEESSFEKLSDVSGALWPENHRNFCENQCSQANPVEILMAVKDSIIHAPSAKSVIVFCQSTGGHHLIQSDENIALSMNGSSYGGVWSIWENKADDAVNKKWHDETAAKINRFSSQHYIGETDIAQDPNRVYRSYTKEKWEKLEKIRLKYDPDNLFFGFLDGL